MNRCSEERKTHKLASCYNRRTMSSVENAHLKNPRNKKMIYSHIFIQKPKNNILHNSLCFAPKSNLKHIYPCRVVQSEPCHLMGVWLSDVAAKVDYLLLLIMLYSPALPQNTIFHLFLVVARERTVVNISRSHYVPRLQ